MSELPELATLQSWMRAVDRQLRDLAIGNPLNRGSVQNADGRWVPLQSVAFGQVVARDPTVFGLATNTPAWILGTPMLDVYVQGGRLRVDVAANLVASGINLRMGMGYRVVGPSPNGVADGTGPMVQAPDEGRALLLLSTGQAAYVQMAAGFPDLVEGLAPGWYRVQAAYQLSGEDNTPDDTAGNASNRRLFAAPL